MRKTLIIVLVLALFGVVSKSYAGLVIGSDIYFNTSLVYDSSNDIKPGGSETFVGQDSVLLLGLYPILSDKGIKGSAKIFIDSQQSRYIWFGGAKIAGTTSDENFTATISFLEPAIAMSDPMATGSAYAQQVYTSTATRGVRFSDGSNTVKYPVIFDEKWMNGANYELGGGSGVGFYSKVDMLNKLLSIEDFVTHSLADYDAFGAMFRLNSLKLGPIALSAGVVSELLKYKTEMIRFSTEKAYLYSDITKYMPEQTIVREVIVGGVGAVLYEDSYSTVGGFLNIGVMQFADVFAQIKMTKSGGEIGNPDATNAISGTTMYFGAVSKFLPGSIIEIVYAQFSDKANIGNFGLFESPVTKNIFYERSGMDFKVKAYGGLDFEVAGMKLFYLGDFTYLSRRDNAKGFIGFENLIFTTNNGITKPFENINGIDFKASIRFDFFYMFRFRQLIAYTSLDYNNSETDSYKVGRFESRSYIDVDLEDVTKGLWVTGGIRIRSWTLGGNTNNDMLIGDASSLTPYFEVKYIFGEDSYMKLSFGASEFYSALANSYGIGLDQAYKSDSFSTYTDKDGNSKLYNATDYNLQNDYRFNLEVGLKL